MPNVAEIVRNVTLGASIMMPGAAVDQTRKFDTSSPLSQGRTELVAGTYSRIDRNNPTITVFDQELQSPAPSAEPSFPGPSLEPTPLPTDPRTGLVICPSPSPEVSPSPSPTPIIIAAARRDDGSTVVITLAQELPSAQPSLAPSLEPGTSPTPDPETAAVDTNGDGVIDENDQTAVDINGDQRVLSEEDCAIIALSRTEYVDHMVNQELGKNGTIDRVSYAGFKRKINSLWTRYKDLIGGVEFPKRDGEVFSKEFINWTLDVARNGNPNEKLTGKHLKASKASYAASLSIALVSIADVNPDPYLKRDLYAAADTSYDYAVTLNAAENIEESKELVDDEMRAFADYYLN